MAGGLERVALYLQDKHPIREGMEYVRHAGARSAVERETKEKDGVATGRFRRKLLPIRPRAVLDDFAAALRGRLSHDDLTVYNSVQRLLYAGVLIAGVVIVLSGVSIWKPVQFKYVTALFGGYDTARYVHFFAMAAIVAFLTIHVALALIVPKSLRAIIFGR